jgi:hypothetical protein
MQAQSSIVGTFGGGAADTVMHPVVAIAMVVAIVLMLWLPRKYAAVPFLLGLFLLPAGQELHLGGVHLYVPRIMISFGLARLLWEKQGSKTRVFTGGWNDLDKIFTCWAVLHVVAGILYYGADAPVLLQKVAFLWDTLGGYYLLRFLIRDTEDVRRVAKTFAIIVGVLGIAMLNEHFRDQNVFGYFGSISVTPALREGAIRAQGPFAHSILAGSFAATLLPFFVWLWQSKRTRLLAAVGVVGSTAMVISSSSSTPLSSYVAVILGICFWPLRGKMRTIRWVFVILLIACALAMKAPVWFLIARIHLVAGNSGYHRAELIDMFFRHFKDWWLIGTDKQATWGKYGNLDDLCEQWISEGETGGLATLLCFLLLITRSFSRIGKARNRLSRSPKQEWLLWLIGVALFAHCVGYFGISYFDQTKFSWFALLAMISVVTTRTASRKATVSFLTIPQPPEPLVSDLVPTGSDYGVYSTDENGVRADPFSKADSLRMPTSDKVLWNADPRSQ